MNTSISCWRVYFPCPMDADGSHYIETSQTQIDRLQKEMKAGHKSISVVTGREIDMRKSRTLYVNPDHIVLMEPRVD